MNNQRRVFLNQLSFIAGAAALSKPLSSLASIAKNNLNAPANRITICHTSDLNGHIGPVYKGFGGLRQIKTLMQNQGAGGLLFDGGNFLNSSASLSHQMDVIHAMNSTGYLAAALGGNELAGSPDQLLSLVPKMEFDLVNCNFQFDNNLANLVKQYVIVYKSGFKIGVTGVCRQLKGIKYNDAFESANRVARLLKEEKKCDLVICLSQLGNEQDNDGPGNQKLAEQSENIDMVVAGNDPRLCINAKILRNKLNQEIIFGQTCNNALQFGKTTINFDSGKRRRGIDAKHFFPGMAADQSHSKSFHALQLDKDLPV